MVIASQRLISRLASSRQAVQHHARRALLNTRGRAFSSLSPQDVEAWKARGILDERELTVFETLHEMQVNSCEVYSKNKLFGTYAEASKSFEWMTFQEFADKVNQCRSVLKDLGRFFFWHEPSSTAVRLTRYFECSVMDNSHIGSFFIYDRRET